MAFRTLRGKEAKAEKKVWWPVEIYEALDDGKQLIHKVKVRFLILPTAQATELSNISDRTLLDKVVVEWQGFQDEAGAEVPLDEERRDEFFGEDNVRVAVIRAYFEAAVGGRRKN